MRRVLPIIFFFLIVFVTVPHVFADVATTSAEINGILIPGVTCGTANDPDAGKARCCVPKEQDDSVITTVLNWAVGKPIVGVFVSGYTEKYKIIEDQSKTMDPCILPGVPSTPKNLADKSCICIENATSSAILELNNFCKKYFTLSAKSNELQKCSRCMIQTGGFYTGFGCIPLDLPTFISTYILNTGIGIAGGIALLCIMYSAFRMQSSMGNAEAIKKAQESMTACITGLIVVIFSVLILKIIGVNILRIPGLGN